jgi:hypothetical protein
MAGLERRVSELERAAGRSLSTLRALAAARRWDEISDAELDRLLWPLDFSGVSDAELEGIATGVYGNLDQVIDGWTKRPIAMREVLDAIGTR